MGVDFNENKTTRIGLLETETPEGLSTQPQAQAPSSALIGQGLLPIDPGSTTGRTEIDGSEESKTAVPTGDTTDHGGVADAAGSVGTMSGTKRKHEIEDLMEDRTKPAKELRRLQHIRIVTIDSAGMSLLKYQHTRQLVVAVSHGTCIPSPVCLSAWADVLWTYQSKRRMSECPSLCGTPSMEETCY